jgi:hypothetical protein
MDESELPPRSLGDTEKIEKERIAILVMDRAEVKQRVIAIARELHALAASSYGPTGRVKVLQPNEDSPDAVEVTTVAERICNRVGCVTLPKLGNLCGGCSTHTNTRGVVF